MTEENTPTETPVAETPAAPTSMVKADGTFVDGWQGMLQDETLREDQTLKAINPPNVESLAKSYVHVRRQVPMDKIAKPTEASSPKDWDDWYTAGGRPQAAIDYGFTKPDQFPEEHWNQDYADGVQEILWKFGGSKKLADALFEFDTNFKTEQITKVAQEQELSGTELRDGLRKDWGDAYTQKFHFANSVVEDGTGGDEQFKARLLEKYGNEPDFIRFAANIGTKFREHGAVDTSEIVPTPGDIQAQIDAAQGNPAYGPDYAKHGFSKAQHRQQVQLVQRLYNKKMISQVKTG